MNCVTFGKHTRNKALEMGYVECPDEKAYSGAYYVKNGMKWIFTIEGLKHDLRVRSDAELRKENYDVDTYYILEKGEEINELGRLYTDLAIQDGEPVYLESGMYLYPDGTIK